jgi:hypothetical protein
MPRETAWLALPALCATCLLFAQDAPRSRPKPADRQPSAGAAQSDDAANAGALPATGARSDSFNAIVSGKVVMLADALEKRSITSYAEEIKGQVVLETRDGKLLPLVPDWRGRAFYQDERLRNRPVDLLVKRHAGVPWVQVLSIYLFDENGKRNIMDYWCDICSIPMYEIKECECCQGPIRLRLRPQELPKLETK